MSAASEGFVLVDRWRVAPPERSRFLESYRQQVLPIIRELPGFRDSTVLTDTGPSATGATNWNLEVLYEFESDAILDTFHEAFAQRYRDAFPGRSVNDLLTEIEPWVTAHDDTTMERLTW